MTTALKVCRTAALVTALTGVMYGALWASQPPPQPPPEAKKADAPKPPEPPKPVIQKTFAVAPVTTALQHRLLEASDPKVTAVVVFDGLAAIVGPNAVDPEAFNMAGLREALRAYRPDKSKSLAIRVIFATLPNEQRDAGKVVELTLEGVGRRAKFGNVHVAQSMLNGKFNLAEYADPLKENKGADLDEAAVGDDRATAYPVRTPLGRILAADHDAVIDIKVMLKTADEAWIPADLNESVKAALKKLALPKGGKVMFLFETKGADANNEKTDKRLKTQAGLWLAEFGLEVGTISHRSFTR